MCVILDLSDAQVQFAFYDDETGIVSFPLAVEQDSGQIIDIVRNGNRVEDGTAVAQLQPRDSRFGLTEYIIRTQALLLIPEAFSQKTKDLRHNNQQVVVWPTFGRFERSTHAWLGVPMSVQGRIIGVINVQSLKPAYPFDQEHLRLLKDIADQAATAIENARAIRSLQDLSLEIGSSHDLEDMTRLVAQKANSIGRGDFTTVFLYDPSKPGFYKGVRAGDADLPQPSLPSTEGLAGTIISSGEEMIVEDCRGDSRLKEQFVGEKELVATAGFPMRYGNASSGVIFVNHQRDYKLNESQLSFLRMLAGQAAVSIENGLLYQRLENKLIKKEQQQQALQKLLGLNDLAGRFVHKVSNLAGMIPLNIETIQESLTSETPDLEAAVNILGESDSE